MPGRTPTEAARPSSMWWSARLHSLPRGGCCGLGTEEGRNCLTWLWHCDVLSCSAELEVKGRSFWERVWGSGLQFTSVWTQVPWQECESHCGRQLSCSPASPSLITLSMVVLGEYRPVWLTRSPCGILKTWVPGAMAMPGHPVFTERTQGSAATNNFLFQEQEDKAYSSPFNPITPITSPFAMVDCIPLYRHHGIANKG